jgi:hypothetical protein
MISTCLFNQPYNKSDLSLRGICLSFCFFTWPISLCLVLHDNFPFNLYMIWHASDGRNQSANLFKTYCLIWLLRNDFNQYLPYVVYLFFAFFWSCFNSYVSPLGCLDRTEIFVPVFLFTLGLPMLVGILIVYFQCEVPAVSLFYINLRFNRQCLWLLFFC